MARDPNEPVDGVEAAADLPEDVDRESLASAIVEGSADAVVSVDEEATVVFANAGVRRVFGYDPSDLVGEPLTTLIPGDRREGTGERGPDAAVVPPFDGAETAGRTDVRLAGNHREDGEIQLSITFHEHRHGDRRFFSGVVRDVTARVERERELERENERLEYRNERLERFASILSHDLREPLNAARAQCALLREYGDERHLDELESIHDRMAEIIEDVLRLTKEGGTVDRTEPVDLDSVARDAWATAGAAAGTLDVRDDATLRAHPERLRTLLENLLGNAVRHAGEDVTATVSTLTDGDGFYVADDGPGIPPEDRDEAFEYGFTTAEDGTGLGLSIVRDVAQAHGWSVRAAESEAGGARFEFRGVEFVDPPGDGPRP